MRQPLWKKAATRHLVPRLHGDWVFASAGVLVRQPHDLFACLVLRENSAWGGGYYLWVAVDALYEPRGTQWNINIGTRLAGGELWPNFDDTDDAEPEMARIARLINTEGAALFDQYATLDGYRRKCASYNRDNHPNGIGDANMLRREALTEILLGRYDDAVDSFELILRAAEHHDGRQWLITLADEARRYLDLLARDPEAATDAVRAGIRSRKEALKLPPA